MKIEFTKKQFKELLKIVCLGDWMANAIHNGSKEDPRDEKLAATADYVFSFAKEAGFDEYIENDKKFRKHFPTNKLDTLVQKYIEEYDEDCFWEELFYRMYDRDFTRTYSEKEIQNMKLSERFEKEEPFQKRWDDEIGKYGIDRLEIIGRPDTESIDEILVRRKEIEEELTNMLKETKSDFSLQDVKNAIFHETDNDDMVKVMAMFDRGGDASELSNILELTNDAWNYFPHKILDGISPVEKLLEYHNGEENEQNQATL